MERMVVWKLDSLINIEDIPRLLNMNHNKRISFLEGSNHILRNRWIPTGENNTFQINEGSILGKTYRYTYAIGNYEQSLGERKSYVNDVLLDRDLRVFNKTCQAVFFEYETDVYIVLQTNKSNESTIRSSLMGQARGEGKIEAWGKVDYTDHLPFKFTSNFFYWLLSKKGTAISREDNSIEVHDVSAVAVLSDRSVYNTSSEGEGLLEGSVGALSVLSTNENINNIGLILKIGKYNLDFKFDYCAEILIDEYKTYYEDRDGDGNILSVVQYEDSSSEFIVLLFTVIFPILIEEFSNDAEWDEAANLRQQKSWALDVVKKLIQHTGITLQELLESLEDDIQENVV